MEMLNTVKERYNNEKLPPLILKELIKIFELQCERTELGKWRTLAGSIQYHNYLLFLKGFLMFIA